MLEQVSKSNRKDLVASAMRLYKSGAEPCEAPLKDHYSRAEMRRAARAFGWRGAHAKRHNIERQKAKIAQALMIDEALAIAKDRAHHPLRSRLRVQR